MITKIQKVTGTSKIKIALSYFLYGIIIAFFGTFVLSKLLLNILSFQKSKHV
jgi:hypothetical protein